MATYLSSLSADFESLPSARPPTCHSRLQMPYVLHDSHQNTLHVEGSLGYLKDTEEFPELRKPVPQPQSYKQLATDPTLCITPEKAPRRKLTKSKTYPNHMDKPKGSICSGRNRSNSKELKASQSVRFNNNVDIKYLSPDSQSDKSPRESRGKDCVTNNSDVSFDDIVGPSLDCSVTDDEEAPSQSQVYPYYLDDDLGSLRLDNSDLMDTARHKSSSGNKSRTRVTYDPQSTMDYLKYSEDYQGLPSLTQDVEHPLARPEFLSSLRVSKEIQQLQGRELDVNTAVEKKLKSSSLLRERITEKVTSKVNVSHKTHYPQLISLEVSEADLVEKRSMEQASRVKPAHKSRKPRAEDRMDPPDLMEFYSSDLQRETASLSLSGLPRLQVVSQSADPLRAFDVYHHIRVWEDW